MRWHWPWQHPGGDARPLTAPTTPADKAQADAVLAELHDLSILAVRTELLLRQHGQELRNHRHETEHDGHAS